MAILWNDSLKDINYDCIHKIEFATWGGGGHGEGQGCNFKNFHKAHGDNQKLTSNITVRFLIQQSTLNLHLNPPEIFNLWDHSGFLWVLKRS